MKTLLTSRCINQRGAGQVFQGATSDSATGKFYKYFETSGFSGWRYINAVAVGS